MNILKVKKLSREKGITLVALVITIVILIILATVTINAVFGENGLIRKAEQAKEMAEEATRNETYELGYLGDALNEYTTGIKVEQVTDTNPGVLEGNGTEIEPYVINSIEDLVFFSYDVTNGNNYEGEYVSLGLNLDFNSTKSYVDAFRTDYDKYGYNEELKTALTTGDGFNSIGASTVNSDNSETMSYFAGIFDGNNFVICNTYMHKNMAESEESYEMALFGQKINGEIKNLGLVNLNYELINSNKSCCVSGIVVSLPESSKINNCYVSGSIKQLSKGKGNINCSGIVTYNRGHIENCYNLSNITGESSDNTLSTGCYIGGITVNTHGNYGYISNCYNKGNIIAKGVGNIFEVGGISRTMSLAGAKIENSYNAGNIILDIQEVKTDVKVGRNCSNNVRRNNNK